MNASVESAYGGHSLAVVDLVGPGMAGERYLAEFKRYPLLAVMKISGGIVDDPLELERTTTAMAFLQEHELPFVAVHGGGPQITNDLIDAELATGDKSIDFLNGYRITSPEAAKVVHGTLTTVNTQLVEAINNHGGQAEGISQGVFRSGTLVDEALYGQVAKVEQRDIDVTQIKASLEAGRIPIVSCIGELITERTAGFVPVNINGDVAAAALAKKLRPHKFIVLTGVGAVLDKDKNRIKELDRQTAEWMKEDGSIDEGMIPKVDEAFDVLDSGTVDEVQFVAPGGLLIELFTDGSGTIIRPS